jgi:HEAT repeat protein
VLPGLVRLLEQRPIPDPELAWAAIFLFGSIAGADSEAQVLRLVRALDLGAPDMAASVVDALALTPNPELEAGLRAWLEGKDVARKLVAIGALGRRRALTGEEVAAAIADADRAVVLAAASVAGLASTQLPHDVLARLVNAEDEALARAGITAAFLEGSPLGLVRAYGLVGMGKGRFADAAMFLALGADAKAREPLRANAAADGSPISIEALGWLGDVEAVPFLLGMLEEGDPGARAAAVAALFRLTGAPLTKDDPDPPYPEDAPPFSATFHEPLRAHDLTDDAAIWRAWWERHGKLAKVKDRYRFGHRWSVHDNMWELEDPQSGQAERTFAYLELCARSGGDIPLDLDHFVARQRRQLGEWRAFLGEHPRKGARWSTTLRRRRRR